MCDISMDSSTNLHNLHEDDLVRSSNNPAPSLPSPCFSVANNDHSWRNTSNFFMPENHHQNSAFQQSMQYKNIKGINTTFSQIFPSVNISHMSSNNMVSPISSRSSSIDQMAENDQGGFDLFTTARFISGETVSDHHSTPTTNHLLELFDGNPRFSVNHDLQQSSDLKLSKTATNLPTFNKNGVPAESKNYIMEHKSTNPMATKKQRFESHPSCPPFKFRKEKLGDRIAALQQLVAPFGKTDTASVLMEAFGYINFLQNQIETLSVPYMKQASRNHNSNNQREASSSDEEHYGSEEQKTRDLKSRGLCLVPLSFMSYLSITNDATNGAVWLPPTFSPAPNF